MQRSQPEPVTAIVDVCGTAFVAIRGEPLLRGLERAIGRTIAEGNYCWTGECGHCEVVYESGGRERSSMACLLPASDGLRVTGLSPYLRVDLRR